MTEQAQTRSGQTFRQALAQRIDPVVYGVTVLGEMREESREVHPVDVTGVKSPVERGDRGFEFFVEHDPHERIAQVNAHNGSPASNALLVPVQLESSHLSARELDEPIVRAA